MIAAIVFAVIVVVAIPVGFLLSATIGAAVIGYLLNTRAEEVHAGSELLDTNF